MEQRSRLVVPVGESDHTHGPIGAAVTLVEYGDFECPYSRAAMPIVQALQQRLSGQIRVVFRHFPLVDIHRHAQHAAEAAEAAAAQGKFWEMHDYLFAHQDALDDADLVRYAASLNLDIARFEGELATHSRAERVHSDVESGVASGAPGTPTFYLDGYRYDGPVGLRDMLTAMRRSHPELTEKADLAAEPMLHSE